MNDNEMNRRVCFEGRECKVVYAYLYAGDHYDIWLMDIKTEKYTDICSVNVPGLPLDERQRLVREEYVELLAEAGIVQPTGEVIEIELHGRLYKCGVPERERDTFWDKGFWVIKAPSGTVSRYRPNGMRLNAIWTTKSNYELVTLGDGPPKTRAIACCFTEG